MGYAKEQWARRTALGYGDVPDKYVCAGCFEDYAIKEFIKETAVEKKCSYCNKKSKVPIAAELEIVVDFICQGINTEWEDPVENLPYESAEGGYQGARVIDSDELIRYEIEELENTDEEVLEDIILALAVSHDWCKKDPYGLRKEEALSLSWADFAKQVKHYTRYVFLELDDEEDDFHRDLDMIPVSKMLSRLSWEISKMEYGIKMTSVLDIGCKIYRARIHDKEKKLATAKKLGTVTVKKAKYANRMSPAGIPMFYGSFEANTAFKEIVDISGSRRGKIVSIATFKTLKKLRALDLCHLPEVPSLFDTNSRHLRSSLIFMRDFREEFRKPINKSESEDIEYVPTQVFTEYIRHKYEDIEGNPIEGILYPSSRNPGGISCVLFILNEQCVDKHSLKKKTSEEISENACLFLEEVERRSPYKR
ncbi:RES domain-containing protein [Candidatus Bathyarchaeota archaeon]|nr:RES domain-containing protein [Candidatus Bathyarchaeota archaeon]